MSANATPAIPPFGDVGARIRSARQRRGLSQKQLARAVGVPLWRVEQVELGKSDPTDLLPSIASVTESSVASLERTSTQRFRRAGPTRVHASTISEQGSMNGRNAVLISLALLIVVRFFTEVVPFVPGAGNFIDIPLLAVLALMAAQVSNVRGEASRVPSFAIPAGAFLLVATVATLLNLSRVEPAPVLVFLYGFLSPVAFYYVTYRLWPAGQALSLSRLLVALGLLEFAVVAIVDLPRFAGSRNPDTISGTFGNNAYQLVYFLVVFAALIAGIATFERGRVAARFAPLLLGATFLVIFLAQYRALLVATAIATVAAALLLSVVRGRGVVIGVVAVIALVLAFSYVASHFPTTKFAPTISAIRADPGVFVKARLNPFGPLFDLYSDRPGTIPLGTGPGTYSSRAWRTFADVGDPASAEGAEQPYASALIGGHAYHTDVSDKYVLPHIREAQALLGSKVATAPFSSYVSLLAEVGLLGFVLLTGIYVAAFARVSRLTLQTMRRAQPEDPLPALALATSIAFLLLFQMAFLDNWWEVARVTVPAWVLLAAVSKEVMARGTSDRP